MRSNYQVNASTQFCVLSEDQCQEIYLATLKVMQETGFVVYSDEALEILKDNGAWVEGTRVRIPSFMVEKARATAPATFTIYSREGDGSKNIEVSPNHVHYGPSATATHFLDPRTGERRKYLRKDAIATARVCDALPNIDFVASLGTISDVNPNLADVYEFADMIANTGKPIMAWSYTLDTCRDIYEIATAVAGSEEEFVKRPNYFFFAEPSPPLVYTREATEKLIFCARHRVPLVFAPVTICGGLAPATLAGALVTAMADSLLGLVIAQILNPGTPYVIGGTATIMDMSSGIVAYGAPELSLLCAAAAEIARYIELPHWSTGGCSDSKIVDNQAALEGAISILFAGLCGSDLVHNVGFIESCITGSLQQLVLMDEVISFVKRILRGIEVTSETLAVDVINKVRPGGHFLNEEHTLKYFKTEFWYPTIMDRHNRENWEALGQKSMNDRVQEKLNKILDTHKPTPLPPEVLVRIEEILAAAEKRIADAQDKAMS